MNKILIAEDSPTQAEQLRYILEKQNYSVIVAKDGQEAIEKALLYLPSLVISDIVMPKKDGYELCQELKSNISTSNIPVILLTSLSNSHDVIEGLAAGASSFLTKPYNENYLLKHIDDVLLNTNSSSNDRRKVNVEIMIGDKKRVITTDPQQMLTLLVSSYEAAIQRNTELTRSQDELLNMNERLEELVDDRTAELSKEIVKHINTQEELKNSFSLLDASLESIADGVLVVDLNRNILKINSKFHELFKIPESILKTGIATDVSNYMLSQMKNPREFQNRISEIYENPLGESHDNIEFVDGRVYERFSRPQWIDNKAIGRVWSFMDITDHKKAEEEIKLKNEALQKAIAEKDKFFSIIAHDLRSPFNGFIGLTKIMVEEPEDITPDELSKISRRLYDSANNVYSLLNNLLEWALIQKDSTQFSPEKTKLLPIALSNAAIIEERARQKGISLVNHISDNHWVYADSKMVNTILRNLLSNAVKFTRTGGTIELTEKKIESNMVEIAIRDTGTGMSSDKLEKLFNIDNQVGSKGTDGEPSTGLGLILCKEFVEKNGGQIRATSQEGLGSEFYFTLPSIDNIDEINTFEKTKKTIEEKKKQMNNLKILIAEDDEASQLFLKIAVKEFSKDIIVAFNGADAVKACLNQPGIDLVLMDIKMPVMDGHEATRQIRKFNKDLIIIAQTAFAQIDDKEKALSHGFNDYISKPINQKILSGIIEKYFKKNE